PSQVEVTEKVRLQRKSRLWKIQLGNGNQGTPMELAPGMQGQIMEALNLRIKRPTSLSLQEIKLLRRFGSKMTQ
ncbi:hypothetical protein PSY29_23095, partial [Shigella flexneri]|nr:hypothetical protein [Shigella flexneri]